MKEKDRDVGTRRSLCHCFTPGNSRLERAPHELIVIQGKKITSEKKKEKEKNDDKKKRMRDIILNTTIALPFDRFSTSILFTIIFKDVSIVFIPYFIFIS